MYWYWIYLARGKVEGLEGAVGPSSSSLTILGRILLLPQAFLLAYSSIGIAPYNNNLGLALFVQTFLFVTNNKVITAQYFTWYLCLLPLCQITNNGGQVSSSTTTTSGSTTKPMIRALVLLLCSIGLWLGSAYLLEMQGLAVHRLVWIASVVYYFANVHLMGVILLQSSGSATSASATTEDQTNTKKNK
jgi:phosphatidylinositol glycan class M